MNELTKIDPFLEQYAFAMHVQMNADAGGIAEGVVVPRAEALMATPPALSGNRKLLTIKFGPDDPAAFITFYNPDGSIAFENESTSLPNDDVLNPALNVAWTGNADSKLMECVQSATGRIFQTMVTASQVSKATGASAQLLFNTIGTQQGFGDGSRVFRADEAGNAVGEEIK